MNITPDSKVLVVFHDKCPDGYASAVSFHENNRDTHRGEVEYLPMTYEERGTYDFLQHFHQAGGFLVCVDFSLTSEVTGAILKAGISVIFLDHHTYDELETQAYEGLVSRHNNATSEKGKFLIHNSGNVHGSGVMHVLSFFNAKPTRIQEYISDRDTWTKRYDESDLLFHMVHPLVINAAADCTMSGMLDMAVFYERYQDIMGDFETNTHKYMTSYPYVESLNKAVARGHFDANGAWFQQGDGGIRVAVINGVRYFDGSVADYVLKECGAYAIFFIRQYVNGVTELSVRTRNGHGRFLGVKIAEKLRQYYDVGSVGGHLNATGISISGTTDTGVILKAIESLVDTYKDFSV